MLVAASGAPLTPLVDKLTLLMKKIFNGTGVVKIEMPTVVSNGKKSTTGYFFLEFASAEKAAAAVKALNGHVIDKKHSLSLFHFAEMKALEAFDSSREFVEPEVKPFEPRGNLLSWLEDEQGRDQFVVRQGDDTRIYWNSPQENEPVEVFAETNWTDGVVVWSSQGRYIATRHSMGVALWGGASWDKMPRFKHDGVKLMKFSPCERFLLTWNGAVAVEGEADPETFCVWNVRTGMKCRGFPGWKDSTWPSFQFSHNGDFIARIGQNGDMISVYETETFSLLDKKSLKLACPVSSFSWSPTRNSMALWTPEFGEAPARVQIIDFPSREEVRQKNLFHVKDLEMSWSGNGNYLYCRVERNGAKKTAPISIEVFRVADKDVPVETLEFSEPVVAMDWDPRGDKFCVISGDGPRFNLALYDMAGGEMKRVFHAVKKEVNSVFWSPTGRFLLCAGMKQLLGKLEFYDTQNLTAEKAVPLMRTEEHTGCTDVVWDPTGRYVTTVISALKNPHETGYCIWNVAGVQVYKYQRERFYEFIWRPRPPTLITKQERSKVLKNLRSYAERYEVEDERKRKLRISSQLRHRLEQMERYRAFVKAVRAEAAESWWSEHCRLRGYPEDESDNFETISVMEEVIVEEKREVIRTA